MDGRNVRQIVGGRWREGTHDGTWEGSEMTICYARRDRKIVKQVKVKELYFFTENIELINKGKVLLRPGVLRRIDSAVDFGGLFHL
jgi:hypothetical protein